MCLAAAFSANAQFVQNGSYTNTGGSEHSVGERGFNKIVSIDSYATWKYSIQTTHGLESGSDKGLLTGIIYTRSQCLANVPLYLEFGGGFLYTSFKDAMYTEGFDLKFYSLYVPINMSYRFNCGGDTYVSLFAGPYMKYNFAGTLAGMDIIELGGAKKTQFGVQAGFDVSLDGFYLSTSYFGDFTDLIDGSSTGYSVKNRVSGVLLGIGIVF